VSANGRALAGAGTFQRSPNSRPAYSGQLKTSFSCDRCLTGRTWAHLNGERESVGDTQKPPVSGAFGSTTGAGAEGLEPPTYGFGVCGTSRQPCGFAPVRESLRESRMPS
jgi:hypothetical protein